MTQRGVTVYINEQAKKGMEIIFSYLKAKGDIPANAEDMSKYRAQIINFAVAVTVGELMLSDDANSNPPAAREDEE